MAGFQVKFPFTAGALQSAIAMMFDLEEFPFLSEKQCRAAVRKMYRLYGLGWEDHVTSSDLKKYDAALKVIQRHWGPV